ncbi:DUF924 family protein [Dyella sp. 2RAB6]|uniref:DUF924 family protein n=1 Tax=Dyella sp. 2RAB6 TaxID=3232992 RepID=UPI003F917E86
MTDAQDVLAFWFDPAHEALWFERDDSFDDAIRTRFGALHEAAARGELDRWIALPEGWIALLLVLDQFSRNLHRGDPRTFACDAKAQRLALEGIAQGFDQRLPPAWRVFAYLPLEHAEDLALQDRSVALAEATCAAFPGEAVYANYLGYAQRHREVIERFGRFPHRNAVLGRVCTPEELHYLAQPGAGF